MQYTLFFHDKLIVQLKIVTCQVRGSPVEFCCNQICLVSSLSDLSGLQCRFLCLIYLRLFQVRGKLYDLLINCIPPEIILKVNMFLYIVTV